MTAPRCRWSFSLRTLFLVVTICATACRWIVRNALIVRERYLVAVEYVGIERHHNWEWFKSLFVGPNPVPEIGVREGCTAADLNRIRAAYPEADLWLPPYEHPEPNPRPTPADRR